MIGSIKPNKAFYLTIGLTCWIHGYEFQVLYFGLILLIYTIYCWWRDVIRERTFIGYHTSYVTAGLRTGIALFIVSEAAFFFGFFWAFFHSRLSPTPAIGCTWPPTGITPLDPFAVPLLNTTLLLASGVTLTWAHHALINGIRRQRILAIIIRITFGLLFTLLQIKEYYDAPFTIADSIYGSTFYVITGFHGLHVIIGTIFLITNLCRIYAHHFTPKGHFGFEAGAWYWHFVDVIWIILYLCLYCWGS